MTIVDCTQPFRDEAEREAAEAALQRVLEKRKELLWRQGGYEVIKQPFAILKSGNGFRGEGKRHPGAHFSPFTGRRMPLIGLGTWKSKPGQVYEAVKAAIKCGYRHIDCASYYQNEAEVGRALREVLADGWVSREELFITSKLWNSDHGADRVLPALRRSLRDLQLDYLDLYLVHWPVSGSRGGAAVEPPLTETWRGMEAGVRQGLVRSIGVSNFGPSKLEALLQGAQEPLSVCQFEMHPYWRNEELLRWCQDRSIHCTAYSPLGSPDSAALLQRDEPAQVPRLLEHPLVQQVAKAHGKSPAQCLVRWALERGCSVLPKSTNAERIRGNLQGAVDWRMTGDEFEARPGRWVTIGGCQWRLLISAVAQELSSMSHQQRQVDGRFWLDPSGPYRSLDDLWA